MMPFARTVALQVADQLRTEILSGRIPPGTRLLQNEEATRLGVSRTPVREAFRQLETENLVEIIPHRGAVVTRLSLGDIQEIYLIRQHLEPLAALKAAANATDEDVSRIEEILGVLTAASASEDRVRVLELNKQFHFAVYEASHLQQLVDLIGSLWGPVEAVRAAYVAAPMTAKQAANEHRDLYLAVRERDGQAAAEIIRRHLAATERVLIKRFGRADEQRISTSRHHESAARQGNVS